MAPSTCAYLRRSSLSHAARSPFGRSPPGNAAVAVHGAFMQNFYSTTGTDPFTTTPAELGKFQVAESDKWKTIIKKAGIEPE